MGLVLAIPSIVFPSVTGKANALNPDEVLNMTIEEGEHFCYFLKQNNINRCDLNYSNNEITFFLLFS